MFSYILCTYSFLSIDVAHKIKVWVEKNQNQNGKKQMWQKKPPHGEEKKRTTIKNLQLSKQTLNTLPKASNTPTQHKPKGKTTF
jgi:hypothetical protein